MTYEYFLNQIMDETFDTSTHSYYIGLSTTNPETSGISEPSTSGTGYARVEITDFTAATSGIVTNSFALTFPQTLASWGVVTDYVVYDAAKGGNPLFTNHLSASRPLTGADMTLVIEAGDLQITLADMVV